LEFSVNASMRRSMLLIAGMAGRIGWVGDAAMSSGGVVVRR